MVAARRCENEFQGCPGFFKRMTFGLSQRFELRGSSKIFALRGQRCLKHHLGTAENSHLSQRRLLNRMLVRIAMKQDIRLSV